jgi:anti-sigma factor RsiW
MGEGWNRQVISCIDIEQNLIDLLDGSIEAGRREELAKHASECSHCRHLLSTYQPLFSQSTGLTPSAPSQDVWYELQGKINRMEESRSPRLRLPVQWRPAISLSLRSFGLIIGVAAGIFLGNAPTETQTVAETDILEYYAANLNLSSVSSGVDAVYQIDATTESGK